MIHTKIRRLLRKKPAVVTMQKNDILQMICGYQPVALLVPACPRRSSWASCDHLPLWMVTRSELQYSRSRWIRSNLEPIVRAGRKDETHFVISLSPTIRFSSAIDIGDNHTDNIESRFVRYNRLTRSRMLRRAKSPRDVRLTFFSDQAIVSITKQKWERRQTNNKISVYFPHFSYLKHLSKSCSLWVIRVSQSTIAIFEF